MSKGDSPVAEVRKKSILRISAIWLFPLVAGIVGLGLGYRAYSEKGPTITIEFQDAEGLTEGKTAVQYRSMEIGTVTHIRPKKDLSALIVTAELHAAARSHLGQGSRFWIERPRLTAAGFSGVGTLVSGKYIVMDPSPVENATANVTTHFVALEEPPLDAGGVTGIHFDLHTPALGGLSPESPISYKGVKVGAIKRAQLVEDGSHIKIQAFVRNPYAKLIHENTTFWNRSGFDLSMSVTKGVKLDMESLASLVVGGITFETLGTPGPIIEAGARFPLHSHTAHSSSAASGAIPGTQYLLEADNLRSVSAGNEIYYRDESVGTVISHTLHDDARTVGILIHIRPPYDRLVRSNTVFWNVSGINASLGLTGIHIHAESLNSLMAGGIALATPDKAGSRLRSSISTAKARAPGKSGRRESGWEHIRILMQNRSPIRPSPPRNQSSSITREKKPGSPKIPRRSTTGFRGYSITGRISSSRPTRLPARAKPERKGTRTRQRVRGVLPRASWLPSRKPRRDHLRAGQPDRLTI
jgi:paraquat-inducible protein B